jgi:hypothetical protein
MNAMNKGESKHEHDDMCAATLTTICARDVYAFRRDSMSTKNVFD